MATTNTFGGKAVLTVTHVAGMIDMVALPLWIGALMQHDQYSAPEAGITVALFLLGAVVAMLQVRRHLGPDTSTLTPVTA